MPREHVIRQLRLRKGGGGGWEGGRAAYYCRVDIIMSFGCGSNVCNAHWMCWGTCWVAKAASEWLKSTKRHRALKELTSFSEVCGRVKCCKLPVLHFECSTQSIVVKRMRCGLENMV